MAISPDNIITYKNLTDSFLAWLKTSCKNIGSSYASDVPDYLKANYTTKVSQIVKAYNKDGAETNAEAGINISIDNASVIPLVNVSQVESDFNAFMSSRGINIKSDLKITTRGVINFWNNVASFCSSNILFVSGSSSDTQKKTAVKRMYKSVNNFPTVPGTVEGELISSADVETLLSNLEETINRTSKTHQLVYNMVAFSSSSSSSSSCSCCSCSSSSSSSSSMFIGYMKL